MNELISVIMSTYQEPLKWVEQAVDSILNQTYENIEFIIVIDDPENMELINYISNMRKQDSRIVIHINNENMGLPASLNIAIRLARGKYIARMDADDISDSDRLACQMQQLISRDLDLIGCNVRTIDENGEIINAVGMRFPLSDAAIKEHLKMFSVIMHPTWLAKKNIYINAGMYRSFPAAQDYEFLTRIALLGYKLGNVKDTKLMYRINTNSISGTNKILQKSIACFVRQNYNLGKQSSVEDFNTFIESAEGKKKQEALEKFYRDYDRLRGQCQNHKWRFYFIMGVIALLKPGEVRIWFIDVVKERLLRMWYKEYR